MKHACENCVWAKKSDGSGMIVRGNTIFISKGNSLRCTAKVIVKLDMRGDKMHCSSFKPKEDTHGI